MINMRYFFIYLLICFSISFSSSSQIWPKDSTTVNYRIIGFSFPDFKNSDNYKIEIAKGKYEDPLSFEKNVVVMVAGKHNQITAEVPSFSSNYSWRISYLQDSKIISQSTIHYFSTGTTTFLDTNKMRVRVTQPAEKFQDGFVFVDVTRALYDMKGQPVWYLPALNGVIRENASVRDMKLSCKNTITFLLEGDIYEIDYNGEILWKGPNGRKEKGDTTQGYHHEMTRLGNGHYMTMGFEPMVGKRPPVSRDSFTHRRHPDTANKRNPREHLRGPRYGTLLEYDENAKLVWSWEAGKYFETANLKAYIKANGMPEFDIHENSFYFDERNKLIYVSFRNISQVLKISYPSGKVLKAYGNIEDSSEVPGNGFFCGQHACKLNSDGDLYLFDNGCSYSNYPEVVILREPRSKRDSLKSIWEFPCPVELIGANVTAKRRQLSTGGNVMELPDKSIFVSSCSPYNKLFIVNRNKEILWSAGTERWNGTKNEWQQLPVYRASIIPERKSLESLIWNSYPK